MIYSCVRTLCLSIILLNPTIAKTLENQPRHGLAAFNDLALPPNFTHLPYVNPLAPKGGKIVTIGTEGRNTFDSFNAYILKGEPAQNLSLLFDSLMARNYDEPDAVYPLVAKTATLSHDFQKISFQLNPSAEFADGTPLLADDVCYSFNLIKKFGHPQYASTLKNVSSCSINNQANLTYTFTGKNTRDLPLTIALLPIFSKAFYQKHPFNQTSLTPPLGSGPYQISQFKQGSFITYQRRHNYWAQNLPINRGQYNFNQIKLLYFRDRTSELQALKAGELDLREEFTAKHWATEYNIPAVHQKKLIKQTLQDEQPSGAQGFFINMRKEKFADIRVRKALNLAFDFEWSNKNLFFNAYRRTSSFFENSPLRATKTPSPQELKWLTPLANLIPKTVFENAYIPPVSNASGQDRALLQQAALLLDQAGWKRQQNIRVNPHGKTLSIELLIFDPSFERILTPFVRNLKLLGINASVRIVDASQYQKLVQQFEFDIVVSRFAMTQTPGIELLNFFSSQSAITQGSFNLSGLQSTAVDTLISHVINAANRADLISATHALDRTLRTLHIWIPQWYKGQHTLVYWNKFNQPPRKPKFDRAVLNTWWAKENNH